MKNNLISKENITMSKKLTKTELLQKEINDLREQVKVMQLERERDNLKKQLKQTSKPIKKQIKHNAKYIPTFNTKSSYNIKKTIPILSFQKFNSKSTIQKEKLINEKDDFNNKLGNVYTKKNQKYNYLNDLYFKN